MNRQSDVPQAVNKDAAQAKIPIGAVFLTSLAALFLGAGIYGLTAPAQLPALAKPAVAWSLLGVGLMLELGAAVQFISSRRR